MWFSSRNILQNMYLKRRLNIINKNDNQYLNLLELGSLNRNISNILLGLGFIRIGFGLSKKACNINYQRNIIYFEFK